MSLNRINALSTVWYRCPKCDHSYFVDMDDPDRHLLKKTMRCPNFGSCTGKIVERGFNQTTCPTGQIDNTRKVTALELYQACLGVGLANERKCSPKDIEKLLVGSRIVKTHIEKAPDPQRCLLLSLTLDNGKVVHVSSSTKGAIVYKVTEVARAR